MCIYLFRLIFKIYLILVLCQDVCVYAADVAKSDLASYEEVIRDERRIASEEQSRELMASGAAAIFLGLYGYYNTNPNPVIKLMYAATQTAGVLTLGQAIKERNRPHLVLDIDDTLRSSRDGKTVEIDLLKSHIGKYRKSSAAAESRTLAYTSTVLSGLYFYNGLRERGPDMTLRNVYYFLGFNFAIAGSIGFYRIYHGEEESNTQLTMSLFPYPTLVYRF